MNKRIVDILEEINKARSKKAKIEKIHQYSAIVKNIFDLTFNPKIKWLLPPGTPPFNVCKDDRQSSASRFPHELKKMDKFLNIGPYPNLNPVKREKLFIQVLEYLEIKDAELLCCMKDGTLPYDKITKELVEEAFPLLAEKWKD